MRKFRPRLPTPKPVDYVAHVQTLAASGAVHHLPPTYRVAVSLYLLGYTLLNVSPWGFDDAGRIEILSKYRRTITLSVTDNQVRVQASGSDVERSFTTLGRCVNRIQQLRDNPWA